MRKKAPCYGCFKHTMTCRQVCSEFKKWQDEEKARKEEADKAKELIYITMTPGRKKRTNDWIKKGKR